MSTYVSILTGNPLLEKQIFNMHNSSADFKDKTLTFQRLFTRKSAIEPDGIQLCNKLKNDLMF